jgi:hypothetical protein
MTTNGTLDKKAIRALLKCFQSPAPKIEWGRTVRVTNGKLAISIEQMILPQKWPSRMVDYRDVKIAAKGRGEFIVPPEVEDDLLAPFNLLWPDNRNGVTSVDLDPEQLVPLSSLVVALGASSLQVHCRSTAVRVIASTYQYDLTAYLGRPCHSFVGV